jgi:ribonuclease HI
MVPSRGNPGLAGAGGLIISPDGTRIKISQILTTNNVTEY